MAGSLLVVGTGVRPLGQVTVEGLNAIRKSDVLLYAVADPVTERWLLTMKPDARSLTRHYASGKHRVDTYNEMVEAILTEVRAGHRVCAAFYGHPGVFVNPAHWAVEAARAEGFFAEMLPGVSAEDNMIADLGFDPARGGCHSYEASEFIARPRVVDTTVHLILWQVGCIGVLGAPVDLTDFDGPRPKALPEESRRSAERARRNLGLLMKILLQDYPPSHPVVIYEAADLPAARPRIDPIALADLDRSFPSSKSTLYVRATEHKPQDAARARALWGRE